MGSWSCGEDGLWGFVNWVCECESLCGSEEEDGGKWQLKAFQLLKVVERNG